MDKATATATASSLLPIRGPQPQSTRWPLRFALAIGLLGGLSYLSIHNRGPGAHLSARVRLPRSQALSRRHLQGFPDPGDPFRFLPCTDQTLPPALNDTHSSQTWSGLFDPDPAHWNWGNPANSSSRGNPYTGRGIYLCGYLDVPLDYTNQSDLRIVRLAVTKYQVSGLAHAESQSTLALESRQETEALFIPGPKSERTIVINPGGPGNGGTSWAWDSAESLSQRFSDGKYDILGWDPRGVNASLPSISCAPYDADRDRWNLIANQYREVAASPRNQLQLTNAFNDAIFRACEEINGDLPRFVTTAFVARDLEEIRKALDEDDLTGYLVSYGSGIGQTYVNMFPNSSGRVILDGTQYEKDHRLLGGFGWTSLDNATDAWHDGFLGECINAGPAHCALAQPMHGKAITVDTLNTRMNTLLESLIEQPVPLYTTASGPAILTYSSLVGFIYDAMYDATSWPALAQMLFGLENDNSTLAAALVDGSWSYNPAETCSPQPIPPSSYELGSLVICGDAYDAPLPAGGDTIDFYASLWDNMTTKNWIAGNRRFYAIFPCKNFDTYWPKPAEVYRGELNNTLKHPVLLIAVTYDPATPLRNGRRLLNDMGKNARLIVHHGYGHTSRDPSDCTDSLAKAFILEGSVPESQETTCYANGRPYLYGVT
ncbi:hypothetical protein B0J13DRAFT_435645 [Dactylonectria estremocensis]|uniref:AB hydrolase-1 domain-containing protein n=1 Tax=Dactylonectria estremocensis TaxID=1079267 RepID=A0A9P9JHA1_9HYPO|nr:hypothetical protein B0J13DRAFT_435645 [Dactylonectria estremocensis]